MNRCQSRGNEMTDGPFKATKLWNQIIYDFSTGIALKRHRRHLRAYDNCFVASKAVDWLYEYLAANKRKENKQISRQQAIQLLDKFLTYDIIEKVTTKNASCLKFKDNKDLYRLKNENIPYPHLENSRDTDEDISLREEKGTTMDDEEWPTHGKLLVVNAQRNNGLLTIASINKNPRLTFDAASMNITKEIMHQFNVIQPLAASLLDSKEINPKFVAINTTHVNKNGIVLVDDKSKDIPHWVMSAMKCLANWPNSGSSLPRYPGFERDVFNLIREYFVNLDSPMIPSTFYPLIVSIVTEADVQTIHKQRSGQLYAKIGQENRTDLSPHETNTSTPISSKSSEPRRINGVLTTTNPTSSNKMKKEDSVFETVFLPASPMTRILSHDQLTSIFSSIASSDGSLDGSSSPQSLEAFHYFRKPSEARNLQHLATLPRNLRKQRVEGLKRFKLEKEAHKSSLCLMNFGCILQSPCEEGEYMMDKSVTSLKNWHSMRLTSPVHFKAETARTANYITGPTNGSNIQPKAAEGEDKVVALLNLILLLIPPENRRHLHLLLRLLCRVLKNKDLKFFSNHSSSVESYIIETFTRCIINSVNEKSYNEPAAQYLVSVMLKKTEEMFALPAYIKYQVTSTMVNHC